MAETQENISNMFNISSDTNTSYELSKFSLIDTDSNNIETIDHAYDTDHRRFNSSLTAIEYLSDHCDISDIPSINQAMSSIVSDVTDHDNGYNYYNNTNDSSIRSMNDKTNHANNSNIIKNMNNNTNGTNTTISNNTNNGNNSDNNKHGKHSKHSSNGSVILNNTNGNKSMRYVIKAPIKLYDENRNSNNSTTMSSNNIINWTSDQVSNYLIKIFENKDKTILNKYQKICNENNINGANFLKFNRAQWKSFGITDRNDITRILTAVRHSKTHHKNW